MIPLLALGLLGGAAYGQQWFNDKSDAKLAEALGPLIGQGPQPMGPEDPATGRMGLTGGTGLLADPADPTRQMQFAQGLLALPGGRQVLQSFDPMLGRALQSKQWTQQHDTQVQQYQLTHDTQVAQFAKQFGLNEQQARLAVDTFEKQQQQWQATFDAQRADEAERQRVAREQLALHGRTVAAEEARAKGGEGPKLPTGYMWTQSASGIVPMPMPNTPDFVKAKDAEGALVGATQRDRRVARYLHGQEQTTPAGRESAIGRWTGTELWGEEKSQMGMIRAQIVASLGKMQDAGVLQQGDFERYEKLLPDPTSWTGPFSRNKSTLAAYRTLSEQFERKLKQHRESNSWLVPPPPPGTVAR
jgi:hypothetical protein